MLAELTILAQEVHTVARDAVVSPVASVLDRADDRGSFAVAVHT